jgi:hypothetical protein
LPWSRRDSSAKPAEIQTIANFATAGELFALAKDFAVPHIKIAFQASSPKTFGLAQPGWPIFFA